MSDSNDRNLGSGAQNLMGGANPQMLKTVGLLLVALIIGAVMLNVVDDGGTKAAKATKPTTTVPKKKPNGGTEPTTSTAAKPIGPITAPAKLQVMVLNGSGVSGVAASESTGIKKSGYTSQQKADTLATTRKGNAVQCKAGLEREAKALAKQVANGFVVETFPATLPALKTAGAKISPTVQCLIIIGTKK